MNFQTWIIKKNIVLYQSEQKLTLCKEQHFSFSHTSSFFSEKQNLTKMGNNSDLYYKQQLWDKTNLGRFI